MPNGVEVPEGSESEFFFAAGVGGIRNSDDPAARAAFVREAQAAGSPIFVYREGSDAPDFGTAVAERESTMAGVAIAMLSMAAGEIAFNNGVNGGTPGGSGDIRLSTAINLAVGVVAALGGSATKLGRAVYRAAWSAASQLGGQARRAARRVLNTAWRARRAGQAACFVAGTLVATSTGDVPIEEIAAGDVVWSIDETGQAVLSTVTQTFMRTTDSVVTLEIVNERGQVVETLETTPEHPFLTAISDSLEWTPAGLLEPGSPVYSLASGWLHVGSATVQQVSVPVFNFEVERTHSYFVGEAGIGVHNTCPDRPNRGADFDDFLTPGEHAANDLTEHAWLGHSEQFIDMDIRDPEELATVIERIVNNPSASRDLARGRTAYWDNDTGLIVIHGEGHGSVFRPDTGRAYFEKEDL